MPYRAVQSASQSVKKIHQMYKRGGGVKGVLNNVKKNYRICRVILYLTRSVQDGWIR